MKKIKGMNALVTGGAMGIGLATAKRLLKEGCNVIIWDIDKGALDAAGRELQGHEGKVFLQKCDITDEKAVKRNAAVAEKEMGPVDILINNAGYVKGGRFCDHPAAVWERTTAVNLTSMYYTIHAFLPGMYRRDRGHVVNISSGAGLVGMPDLAVYCATKWAVYGLTESLRIEAMADKKKGVHFSSVHPGILRHGMFEGAQFNLLGEILLPRVKDHDDIAKVVVNKAIKKNRDMIMKPWILHVGPVVRAFFPDRLLNRILLLAGADRCMKGWTGREKSVHASR